MKNSVLYKCLRRVATDRANLTQNESSEAFGEIMSGEIPEHIIAAFLTALKMKGETVDEIVGAALAMRRRANFISTGALSPIDTCGTGGDGMDTFNISTTAAFVAAGAGVCVAKHGNRAATGKCGSADLLAELGFNLDASPALMEHCLQEHGIAFLFAQKMHPAMRAVANVRRGLGFRTIFNLLGPLVNPAGAKAHLIGVFDNAHIEIIAECLKRLGSRRAFVVHGADGLDEISATCASRVSELKDGSVKTYEFDPYRHFPEGGSASEIRGGDGAQNAAITLGILKGEINGAARNVCLLNSAAAIMTAGKADNFSDALGLAADSLHSGRAMEKLEKLVKFSNQ